MFGVFFAVLVGVFFYFVDNSGGQGGETKEHLKERAF